MHRRCPVEQQDRTIHSAEDHFNRLGIGVLHLPENASSIPLTLE